MTDNRRSEPRKNAFLFGSIHVDGSPRLDCLVWDASRIGAMIELSGSEQVPDRFSLATGPDQPLRACAVVRRDGRRLGVAFEDEVSSPPA